MSDDNLADATHQHHHAVVEVALTDRQAHLYRHNATFKSLVDSFLQTHALMYLKGAEIEAERVDHLYEEALARAKDPEYHTVLSKDEARRIMHGDDR